jgi:hypothetical protein
MYDLQKITIEYLIQTDALYKDTDTKLFYNNIMFTKERRFSTCLPSRRCSLSEKFYGA